DPRPPASRRQRPRWGPWRPGPPSHLTATGGALIPITHAVPEDSGIPEESGPRTSRTFAFSASCRWRTRCSGNGTQWVRFDAEGTAVLAGRDRTPHAEWSHRRRASLGPPAVDRRRRPARSPHS